MQIVNAFTCTGAYAVLILSGLKSVENRSMMPVPARGRCAMSVSKKFCRAEYDNLVAWLSANAGRDALQRVLTWDDVKNWPGHIVAVMDYEAVDGEPEEEPWRVQAQFWNEGYRYWWLLSNIRRLPAPIPCRGNVGMWQLPKEQILWDL